MRVELSLCCSYSMIQIRNEPGDLVIVWARSHDYPGAEQSQEEPTRLRFELSQLVSIFQKDPFFTVTWRVIEKTYAIASQSKPLNHDSISWIGIPFFAVRSLPIGALEVDVLNTPECLPSVQQHIGNSWMIHCHPAVIMRIQLQPLFRGWTDEITVSQRSSFIRRRSSMGRDNKKKRKQIESANWEFIFKTEISWAIRWMNETALFGHSNRPSARFLFH